MLGHFIGLFLLFYNVRNIRTMLSHQCLECFVFIFCTPRLYMEMSSTPWGVLHKDEQMMEGEINTRPRGGAVSYGHCMGSSNHPSATPLKCTSWDDYVIND